MAKPQLRLKLHGFEQLRRELSKNGEVWQRVQRAAVTAVTLSAEKLAGAAAEDAPIDEGPLRASITAVVYANGKVVSQQGTQAQNAETGEQFSRQALKKGKAGDAKLEFVQVDKPAADAGKTGDFIVGRVGSALPYAAAQEFREDYEHPKGGKAHYLGDNLTRLTPAFRKLFDARLAEALR